MALTFPGSWAWICSLSLEASTPFAWEYLCSQLLHLAMCPVDWGPDPPPWTQLPSLASEQPCHSGLTWWSGLSADPGYSSCVVALRAGVPGLLSCWLTVCSGSFGTVLWTAVTIHWDVPDSLWNHQLCQHSSSHSSAQAAPRAPFQFICTSPKLLPLLKWNILVASSSGVQHHC